MPVQLRRIPHSAECDDPDKLSALVSASSGFSGAECVSFTREAALAALTEDIRVEEVQWRHLSAAASRVKPQITAEMIKFYSDFQTRAGHGGRK